MQQILSSQRRELVRCLVNAIHAMQWGFTYDAYDCALIVKPFCEIALEDEDSETIKTEFDTVCRLGLQGIPEDASRAELLQSLNASDPTIDWGIPSFAMVDGYDLNTLKSLCFALKTAVAACMSGGIVDTTDCAIVVYAFRELATGGTVEGKQAFDTALRSEPSSISDRMFRKFMQRRFSLLQFLKEADPRKLPDFPSTWQLEPLPAQRGEPTGNAEAGQADAGWLYGVQPKACCTHR